MSSRRRVLLMVDATINLLIGAVLLLAPLGTVEFLGLPPISHYFYTSILGAVIFGIGVALLIELLSSGRRIRGLGLGGAVTINLCGGGALLVLLIARPAGLPDGSNAILWIVAVTVLVTGLVELVWHRGNER